MYLDNKLVFLAGATGLVGSGIMRGLLEHSPTARIRAAAHYHTRPFIEHERVEYVYGDLKSQSDCQHMSRGCHCAIMAAANAAGSYSITAQPWQQVNDNLIMNAQMLEAFYHEQVQRVVYIGSITLYQDFEGHIKEEELDLNQDPHPAYLGVGWVHRYTEKLCKFWHEQCGMNIVIVRAANVFGPYAKFDPHTSNFIPAIIRKAVDKMDPFEVWGTPDVTRDVIYSEDFAHAIIGMLDDDQIKFDTFNVGSSMETTVGDVLTWALRYAKHEPNQIKYMADRPTTNKFKALDCSKVKQVLGWQPYYTVEQGIQKTTEWWINNKNWWKK